MILKIKCWCEELIVAIFIAIIIEMLIPEGSNKKYAKVVVGIYILFITMSPILNIFNENIEVDIFNNIKTEEIYSNFDNNIKDVYITGIEESIKDGLNEKNIDVKDVSIKVDSKYENFEKILIKANLEYEEEIKKYILENYDLKEEGIIEIKN